MSHGQSSVKLSVLALLLSVSGLKYFRHRLDQSRPRYLSFPRAWGHLQVFVCSDWFFVNPTFVLIGFGFAKLNLKSALLKVTHPCILTLVGQKKKTFRFSNFLKMKTSFKSFAFPCLIFIIVLGPSTVPWSWTERKHKLRVVNVPIVIAVLVF